MKRFLLWILIPLLFLTANLLPSEHAGAYLSHSSTTPTALEVIAEVNALRAANQAAPFQVNNILMTIAQSHADYIASTGVVTHFGAGGTHPYQRAVTAGYPVAGDLLQGGTFAENIGSGANLSASDIVSQWKNNADNLKTMISADLNDVGVGIAISNGVTYYVLDSGAATKNATSDGTVLPASATPTSGTPSVLIAINTPLEDGTVYHQVQANEALWGIALAYGTTIEQIKLLNRLATDEIFVGQKLIIEKSDPKTATPEVVATATFGIPTSTATRPVTPTITATATPLPTPPTSRQSGGMIVGAIIGVALLAASIGSWMGRAKPDPSEIK